MRAVLIPAAAALAVAAQASAAVAQPAKPVAHPAAAAAGGVSGDVRCLLAMVAFANVNKEHPQAGQAGVYYFAGRIAARAPTLDLSAAVKAQAPTMGPQQLQAEVQRCGPMVNASTQHVQAAINALHPPGAPAAPMPQPAAPTPAAPAAPAPK